GCARGACDSTIRVFPASRPAQSGRGERCLRRVSACRSWEYGMKLSDFIVADAVIPELTATSKEGAIREMVASLCRAGQIGADHEQTIVSAIMKREELGSTGIGRGVAVPHTKHNSVSSLIATVAISREGLDFASLDGENVYILFLLISPP